MPTQTKLVKFQTISKTKNTKKSPQSLNPNFKLTSAIKLIKKQLAKNQKNLLEKPENFVKTNKMTEANPNSKNLVPAPKVSKNQEIKGFNQTEFILKWSKFTNGVAQKHQQVTSENYPNYKINCITNGVHLPTWTNSHLKKVFDKYLAGWESDNFLLKMAEIIPLKEIENAQKLAQKDFFKYVKQETGLDFDPKVMTIGFARRAVAYKRADFVLTDLERLSKIATKFGGLQIIFSGKAHPNDQVGRIMIQKVFEKIAQIQNPKLKVVYLANYNMQISSLMVAGCDLWLNNPIPPLEASGTSGMKAELNGTPNLSVLDGWWLEGHLEGVTGWAIRGKDKETELKSLYEKLEKEILPIFGTRKWLEICRNCIILNGAHFGTNRVVMEYLTRAWS